MKTELTGRSYWSAPRARARPVMRSPPARPSPLLTYSGPFTQPLHSRLSYSSPNPQAQSNANRASAQRAGGRWLMIGPILSRCAVDTWSKFSAQATGIPSSGVNTASEAKPRIVRVAGTTIISFRRSITSSRVRISTGRRLSGARNVYQRISPRLTARSPSLHPPIPGDLRPPKTLQGWAASPHTPTNLHRVSG